MKVIILIEIKKNIFIIFKVISVIFVVVVLQQGSDIFEMKPGQTKANCCFYHYPGDSLKYEEVEKLSVYLNINCKLYSTKKTELEM